MTMEKRWSPQNAFDDAAQRWQRRETDCFHRRVKKVCGCTPSRLCVRNAGVKHENIDLSQYSAIARFGRPPRVALGPARHLAWFRGVTKMYFCHNIDPFAGAGRFVFEPWAHRLRGALRRYTASHQRRFASCLRALLQMQLKTDKRIHPAFRLFGQPGFFCRRAAPKAKSGPLGGQRTSRSEEAWGHLTGFYVAHRHTAKHALRARTALAKRRLDP